MAEHPHCPLTTHKGLHIHCKASIAVRYICRHPSGSWAALLSVAAAGFNGGLAAEVEALASCEGKVVGGRQAVAAVWVMSVGRGCWWCWWEASHTHWEAKHGAQGHTRVTSQHHTMHNTAPPACNLRCKLAPMVGSNFHNLPTDLINTYTVESTYFVAGTKVP